MHDDPHFLLKRRTLKTLAAAGTALVLGACGRSASENGGDGPLKVGFVYAGPVGDAGWTYSHDVGRRGAEAHFGDRIRTTAVESVSAADAEGVFRELVAQGHRLIYGTSVSYADAIEKVARDFPDVRFELASGLHTAPNLATYDVKSFGNAYLAGLLAGAMTRSNQLGVVAPFPTPEVIRNINAFTVGARQVNPNATTSVAWISVWHDPAREREGALHLIALGADVLIQNSDSTAVLQAAEEKAVYGFGWDSDMSRYGKRAHLASTVILWTPYYIQSIQSVLDGTWRSTRAWWGAQEGVIDLVKVSPAVPEATRKLVADKKAAMMAGTAVIFSGPLYDQSGREVIVTGQVANETMLRSMDFYVRGVQGTIPK